MPAASAGILLYRRHPGLELYIAHMGGPFWARADDRAWSIPKGIIEDGEDELAAALREFAEEIGTPAPAVEYRRLGSFRYASGKTITVFAAEAAVEDGPISGNTFELEWPPRSGRIRSFPEVDRAEWVPADAARAKLVAGQVQLVDALLALPDAR